MKAVIEVIVQGLVDEPDEVRVDEVQEREGIVYEVSVAQNDLGKVIGKDGKIANSMRTVARTLGARINKDVQVEIRS